jgi:hypothetical protein
VVTRKKPSIAPEDEAHLNYLLMKKLYRQFQGFVQTLADIRETVGRINAMLDKMNKESDVFWTEFKRDFPEMKLDVVKTQDI